MGPLYFRQFIELDEKQPDYLTALQDELGIDPKAFEASPKWAANMTMGKFSFNGLIYKIENFVYKNGQISGAMVKSLNVPGVTSQRAYLNKGDQKIRMPDAETPTQTFFVAVDNLNKMLSQGLTPGAGGMGGEMGGGMGGGMGGEMNAMLPGAVPQ